MLAMATSGLVATFVVVAFGVGVSIVLMTTTVVVFAFILEIINFEVSLHYSLQSYSLSYTG